MEPRETVSVSKDRGSTAHEEKRASAGDVRGMDHALVSGIAWTAVLRWAATLVSWAGTAYAARILQPSDYGLVSMAMLAIGMARMIEDFGMDAILVQDASLVGAIREQLAGFVLLLGVLISLVFAVLAVPIARFFAEPAVAGIVVALSILFIFDALQVVPRAQLQRELRFRSLGIVALVQVVVTQATLVTAATSGMGYWSLVLNSLAGAIAVTLLLYWWSPYRIGWPRGLTRLATPLLQGWRILASRAAWYAYTNADQIVIGRVLGKDLLGPYAFATTLSTVAQQEVGSVVTKVVPGVFSRVQYERDELRRYFLLLTEFLAAMSFPMAIGLGLVADLAVPLLLGPQWGAVIVPLQLLCVYSVFYTSQALVSHVLMWTGQFRVNMWCSILAGIVMPLAFLLVARRGLPAIGWAWVAVFPIVSIPSLYFAFRTLGIGVGPWIGSLRAALIGCLGMAVAVVGVRAALPASVPLAAELVLAIATGAVVYPAVLWFGFKARVGALISVVKMIRTVPAPAGA